MLLLALDTSTRQASIALCTEQRLYGEYTWQVGNNHSVELLERIRRLCAECDVPLSALDGLAVATGPGSFNGVRVAVATARTLAFALVKPLVGISSLEITAAQFRSWPGPICALLEAGRAEFYTACYRFVSQEPQAGTLAEVQRLGDYQVFSAEQLAGYLRDQPAFVQVDAQAPSPVYLFCGEISATSRQALMQSMGDSLAFAPPLQAVRHASTLATLAYRRFAEKRLDDPLLLEPLYVRRPSITASTRKQPLLGSSAMTKGYQNDQHNTERGEGALRH